VGSQKRRVSSTRVTPARLQPPPRPTPQDIARWEKEQLERVRLSQQKRLELLKRGLRTL